MDILSDSEIDDLVESSKLVKKYNKDVDRESAYEILGLKMEKAAEEEEEKAPARRGRPRKEKSTMETILGSSAARQVGRTAANILTRTLLGALGVSTRKKKWF
jgi:hypothetical protein